MSQHAILSPSAAYRWLICTPSSRFEEQIPEEESEFAQEGTLAHSIAALYLEYNLGLVERDEDYANKLFKFATNKHYSKELQEYAVGFGDFVLSIGGDIMVEEKFDLSAYVPLSYGTSDACNIIDSTLHVNDFKYGVGIKVDAVENKQMMLYALGAMLRASEMGYEIDTVVMTIYQPRVYSEPKSWQVSADYLLRWAETELKEKANLAIAGQGDFVTGEHCRFCKARLSCAAFFDTFAVLEDIADGRAMSESDRRYVLENGDLIAKWIKDVKDAAVKDLLNRKPVKGFKLVESRGKRTFKNEDNVIDILRAADTEFEEMFDVNVKSLTSLEKSLGKKRFNSLFAEEVVHMKGYPTLAKEDDARLSYGAAGADEYD